MFEKLSKHFTSKATEGAIESVKTSFNDRMDQYGDIIKIGLVLSVIIFGGKHLAKKASSPIVYPEDISPFRLPSGNGQPIVINNYYRQENKEVKPYYGKESHARQGTPRKNSQKR